MQLFGLELFPVLSIALLNGWILLVGFYLIELLLVLSFPKGTRYRLFEYDRSKWSKRRRIAFIIGKIIALFTILIIFFSPLKISTPIFYLGIIVYLIGVTGFIIAVINYRNTSLNQPVTHGFYRYSRNPQILSIILVMLGAGLAIGSGFVLIIIIISSIFTRVRILEEERACLEQYGTAYREYMERVPRYLIVRTKLPD
jgi:protein-S-isoprenylcysteine O-methyltransferase Ste14